MTKHQQAKSSWLSPAAITGIILTIIFSTSLFIRIYLPYESVFVGDWVRFRGTDSWWCMRQVDNLLHNFPHRITFDPYFSYPYGGGTTLFPGWLWLLASVTWLIGLGSPSQQIIDSVGAYLPAILGALIVIPVYFIGREIFNRWAGFLGAALIALMPGEFLARTLLGIPDHHVAELLFSTLTIMFLILAIKRVRERQISFTNLLHRDWATIAKPFIYAFLAGISLGIYLLSWAGALVFVFIIFIYLIIQFIIDHLRRKSTDYLGIIGGLTFLIALLTVFGLLPQLWAQPLYQASLLIAFMTPITLSILSKLMANKAVKPALYPLTLAGLGVVSLVIFYVINPTLLKLMLGHFHLFLWQRDAFISEKLPILFFFGYFSLEPVWRHFTTSSFLAFISLGLLIYEVSKRGETAKILLFVWSLIMMALTLAMMRWAYYLAIPLALLTGYFSWKVLEFAGFRESAKPEAPQKLKQKKAKAEPKVNLRQWLAIIIVFLLVFFPNFGAVQNTVREAWEEYGGNIGEDLYRSLVWLKANTPEPFQDPNFYYQLYEPPSEGQQYEYPASAYTIMALSGCGYFIIRVAQRIPVSNPGAWTVNPPLFFTAQDETQANKVMNESGARYVITDSSIMMRFYALTIQVGQEISEFMDIYYKAKPDGTLVPVLLFSPAYYKSMATRLYNFDGKVTVPDQITVISFEEKVDWDGKTFKQLTSAKTFPDYEKAKNYIAAQPSKNYRIVSADPFVSLYICASDKTA